MGRYDDEAELFAEDFQAGYVKNLLRLQQEVIKLPESEEHYDIYLAKKLYPVLLPGVELLAREIDRLTNKESQGKQNHPSSYYAAEIGIPFSHYSFSQRQLANQRFTRFRM